MNSTNPKENLYVPKRMPKEIEEMIKELSEKTNPVKFVGIYSDFDKGKPIQYGIFFRESTKDRICYRLPYLVY